MPAPHPKPSPKVRLLTALLEQAEREFSLDHPQTAQFLQAQPTPFLSWRLRSQPEASAAPSLAASTLDAQVSRDVTQSAPAATKQLAESISIEEQAAVLEKLRATLLLSAGQIEASSLLYLEQQLSELLGFSVTGSLENQVVPYHTGTIQALPHLKRFPHDTLDLHERYVEAGLAEHRSIFGWFMTGSTLSAEDEMRERYFVSLPFTCQTEWQTHPQATSQWYKYRKVVVINPFDARAVVACVADATASSTLQYQLGGSPELIREGLFWSPAAVGRACTLFVDDPTNQIRLGPINLRRAN